MVLKALDLPSEWDAQDLPAAVTDWIAFAEERIRIFWDRFEGMKKPEYTECDFGLAAAALQACWRQDLIARRRMVEWGAGLGVVTGVAELMGIEGAGIEAELFLVRAGKKLHRLAGLEGRLWHGNFLPCGAADLAHSDDPAVALQHSLPPAYERHGVSLSDFGCIFCYAWPGEEHFIKSVVDRFAAEQTLLILYRGPYHIEFYKK